jgi:hypothetical protein
MTLSRRKERVMRGKLTFLAGAAVGFVIGTRAGRERYDDLVRSTRKLLDSPSVHEATGVVQSQAAKLYERGKDTLNNSNLSDKLRHPMGNSHGEFDDLLDDGNRQHMSSNSF